jgi:S-DNA-T family DNA segregation ATPase FtsK/SpoIIIE
MLKKQSAKVIGLIKEPEDDKDPQQKLFKIEKSTKPKQPKKTSSLANTNYQLPPISLLSEPKHSRKAQVSETALTQNGRMLESVLEDFGVHGRITKIRPGPVVTLYELEPAAGTKSSRVIGLADDIARSMSSISARISVIPGKNALGIELPNTHRESVFLREIIESDLFIEGDANLPMALGKNIGGEPVMVDLSKMPHLLVAGTTGSGKSVGVNGMIISLLNKLTPDQCKFIMIDPKMLELSIYDGIPHLLAPVVTDPTKAVVALKWTVKEMENRYRLMSTMGVRNIIGYNQRILEAIAKGENLTRMVQTGFNPETGKPIIEEVPLEMSTLPYIVVVVDELKAPSSVWRKWRVLLVSTLLWRLKGHRWM